MKILSNFLSFSKFAGFFAPSVTRNLVQKITSGFLPKSPVIIPIDKMRSLDGWPDKGQYELMFATKSGLPIPNFPISHSAIALHNPVDDTFSIYGRQSPFDYSMWLTNGLNIRTRKDNEKGYLNKEFAFTAYPTGTFFAKEEINDFLNVADKLINEKQYCNMVNSNCYSYATMAMTLSLQKLLARPVFDSTALAGIIAVMENHPLSDHCSFGVLNNETVVEKLVSVYSDIQTRLNSMPNKSAEEINLSKYISQLLEKIKYESEQYRIFSLPL